jgi:hypothetical protein
LLVGALALLLRRRRRSVQDELYYDRVDEEPVSVEAETIPVTASAAEPAPIIARPLYEPAPVETLAAAAPVATAMSGTSNGAAAANGHGAPSIELQMRPVRAGVNLQDAVVEFELTVGNSGSGAAHDVRISTWMFPAGSGRESEAERMLIERPASALLPEVEAGDSRRIDSEVSLPTGDLGQDSVLPVVVAEARYKLDDGSEASTSATFAVGVAVEGELAHFDIENPSGMHDNVEARALGELERA